jgi:hypothetical protein
LQQLLHWRSVERLAVQRCGRRQAGAAILHDVSAATTSAATAW